MTQLYTCILRFQILLSAEIISTEQINLVPQDSESSSDEEEPTDSKCNVSLQIEAKILLFYMRTLQMEDYVRA